MSNFDKLLGKSAAGHQPLKASVVQTAEALQNMPAFGDNISHAVVNLESRTALQGSDVDLASGIHQSLETLFAGIHDKLCSVKTRDSNGTKTVQTIEALKPESRTQAALAGLLMAGDKTGSALQKQTLESAPSAIDGAPSFTVAAAGGYTRRQVMTAEAFVNNDLKASRLFSTLFNYSIVDFDDFIRTVWRPVTITPDTSFVTLLINSLHVFNGFEHKLDGKPVVDNRVNLVRALANSTILHTNATKAIPVVQAGVNEAFFIDDALVADRVVVQADQNVTTRPLLVDGSRGNLIALAQPEFLIKAGGLDQRDNLDPGVRLETVYLALGDDVLAFPVKGIPGTEFAGANQGDAKLETLSWTTGQLKITKDTKNVDGSALTDLASVVTGNLTLVVRVPITGEINIEHGEYMFMAGKLAIYSLQDAAGNKIAPTDSRYTALVTALGTLKAVAVDVEAYRSNAARRQRGQLINVRQFYENVTVPWRDPIAVERPAHGTTEGDTADLTALMSATRLRIHNEGITAVLDAEAVIKTTYGTGQGFDLTTAPNTLGAGRHFLLPYYATKAISALDTASVSSVDRRADLQAQLVNAIRNEMAIAYTKSEYKAASDALSGGTAPKPKVVAVTDPVTASYLIVDGEVRTMSDFELIIVPVLDYRIRGKIKLIFVSDDDGSAVNYLNFGYLFWSPEHVLVANLNRTGGFNRETQVQPRYRFYVAAPVMVNLDVSGITEAIEGKLPLHTKEVA